MKTSKKTNKSLFAKIVFIILLIYTSAMLFPIFWALINSLKSYEEYSILENITGLPKDISISSLIDNYVKAWENGYSSAPVNGKMMYYTIFEQVGHTLLYGAGCTATGIWTHAVTAYCVAKYDFKFSRIMYNTVILVMIIPLFGSMQSEIWLTKQLGMFDTFWGLWLQSANFIGGGFLLWYGQFKSISKEYSDAARIDGASHFAIMTRVVFPLAKGFFGIQILLGFVDKWDAYAIPMIYLPSYPVLGYGMFQFSQRIGAIVSSVPVKAAYMIVVSIPVLIVFLIFNKKLMGAEFSMGGLKG